MCGFWEMVLGKSPVLLLSEIHQETPEGEKEQQKHSQQPFPRLENNGIFIEQRWLINTLKGVPPAVQQYSLLSDNNLWGQLYKTGIKYQIAIFINNFAFQIQNRKYFKSENRPQLLPFKPNLYDNKYTKKGSQYIKHLNQ